MISRDSYNNKMREIYKKEESYNKKQNKRR